MTAAAKVETTAAPFPSGKVIPLAPLHAFADEEQVKNTDQGNIAVTKARKRKHPMPASNQNIPVIQTPLDKQLASLQQNFNALSQTAKEAIVAKLQSASSALREGLSKLGVQTKDGPLDGSNFDAWNHSILFEYTEFAKDQMNQNGLIMNGWAAQQEAQNASLQTAADSEASNANKSTDGAGMNVGTLIGIGVGVFIGMLILGAVTCGLGFIGGAIGASSLGAAIIGSGAYIAGSAVAMTAVVTGSCVAASYSYTQDYNKDLEAGNSPTLKGGPLTEKGNPDQQLLTQISQSNQFWNTISQKTNNNIQSGSQTNLVEASSNDTSLGQQASQAIQALGDTMKTGRN